MKGDINFVLQSKPLVLQLFLCILVAVSPLFPQLIKFLFVFLLILINLSYCNKASFRSYIFIISAIFLFYSSYITDYFRYGFAAFEEPLSVYFSMCFLLGFLISQRLSIKELFQFFDFIIYRLAIISLLFFSIVFTYKSLISSFIDYNYYHTTHKTIFFHNYLISDGDVVLRNSGIASEPGLFQILISLGFFSYLYLNKSYSFIKIFLYSLALVSTFSTAGLISLILLLMYSVRNNVKVLFAFIALFILFNGFAISYILFHFEYKLFGSYAFQTRLEPLLYSFGALKSDFYGIGNAGITINEVADKISFESFGQVAVRYGYPLFFWLLIVLAFSFNFSIIFFALIFIFLATQLIWFSPIMTIIYFLILKEKTNFFNKLISSKDIS